MQAVPAFFSAVTATQCLFPNPESDTDSNAIFQQLPMRRCASTDLPLGNSACSATLLPCFIRLITGSYRRLADFSVIRIDHRMNPLRFRFRLLLRKEVIQPHLPIRLPCYDFTPVIGLALGGWLPKVASPTLGTPNSHGVTGGVYKARERIHRGMLIRDY